MLERFTKGQRVELVHTNDTYTELKAGDRGTVRMTDSTGTVFVRWDSGSQLGMVPDAGDVIRLVTGEDTTTA